MEQGLKRVKETIAEARDWSNLSMDLVSIITKKLGDLPNFTRFRAVCKNWGSTPLSECPPQLPWLLEWQGGEITAPELESEQQFYSLFSGEIGKISIESHHGREFRGPSHSYLIHMVEEGGSWGLALLNPLTKEEISLPPLPFGLHWPVWTSAYKTGKELVVVDRDLFNPEVKGMCGYHHSDSNEWTCVEGYFYSCCYWNGMLFNTEGGKDTEIYHVNSKQLLHEVPPPEDEIALEGSPVSVSSYLVNSCEEILRVSWYMVWRTDKVEESAFHIHRLDMHGGKGQPCWVKVKSIGDLMIFLEELNGFSMSAKPFAGFQGNCIYILHPWLKKPYRYDIESGTVETVPCPFESGTWFVPSLQ